MTIVQALDTLEHRRRGFDNQMANFHRQLNDLNNKLEKKTNLLSNNESGLKEIVNKIKDTEKELEEVHQDLDKLKLNTETSEKQRVELMAELDAIDEKVHSLKLDKSQIQIAKWEEETLEYLKKTVKGVVNIVDYQILRGITSVTVKKKAVFGNKNKKKFCMNCFKI